MSIDYSGCFVLVEGASDYELLTRIFADLNITFAYAGTRFRYNEDDYLTEDDVSAVAWEAFVADAESDTAALNGKFEGQGFSFTLGIFAGSENGRCALFDISGRNLDRLNTALEPQRLDFLDVLAQIYKCLGAGSLAFGGTDYQTLLRFLRGDFEASDVDKEVRICINAPRQSEEALLANPRAKRMTVANLNVVALWLPGLDARF